MDMGKGLGVEQLSMILNIALLLCFQALSVKAIDNFDDTEGRWEFIFHDNKVQLVLRTVHTATIGSGVIN
jgi:hypothetical protein